MPRSSRFLTIEGEYASGVLGTFRIIRGFATLQDLAEISAPYELTTPTEACSIQGYQRNIDPEHAKEIKSYLEQGRLRFIPEIILSVRSDFRNELDTQQRPIGVISDGTLGLTIRRRWRSQNIRTHQIKVARNQIDNLVCRERRIRRIDGNHRLHMAKDLAPDVLSETKYLAPFCAVLLGPPGDANDDYVESMLFHTINSTALPLDSEHALKLILEQTADLRPTPNEEFAGSASLHLTRLLNTRLNSLPTPQKQRLGTTPSTVLNATAKSMIAADSNLKVARENLERFADELYGALTDVLARMPSSAPELCKSVFFIELASLAWHDTGIGSHDERIARTTAMLDKIGRWLGRDGLNQLQNKQSLAKQLFELHRSIISRIPKRVFLARWYPVHSDGDELRKADLRKQQIERALSDLNDEDIYLDLDDPGTRAGSTFPIHQKMYEALAKNDIILVDLSGVRPNVCIEAGYALEHHIKERLLFIFQPTTATPNNPPYDNPPFDLNTFRYERVMDAAEIPDKIKGHLKAIVKAAERGE